MDEGDFVRLEFDAYVKESGQLIDTTNEEVAKEKDVWMEGARYAPIPVIVGAGHVVKGLDEDLKKAKVGEEREIEVEPREAFGERDPKQVEVMPMKKVLSLPEFRRGDKYPQEGMEVTINNRAGFISRIFTGRVWVDYNNRWAGRAITYKYTVKEQLTDREDKVKAIIENSYSRADEFEFALPADDEIEITLPDIIKLDTSWMMAKFKLVSELRAHLDIKTVKLIEIFSKKEDEPPQEEEGASEEAPPEEGGPEEKMKKPESGKDQKSPPSEDAEGKKE